MLKKSKYVIPKIADVVINDAKQSYEQNNKFTTETLQSLNSVFGEILVKAMDILDTHKFIKYTINTGIRHVLKVYSSSQQYLLFKNINYCTCDIFTNDILTEPRKYVTCEHVLSTFLADIVGLYKVEVVSDSQLTDLLNNQMCSILNRDEI